jgi:hypothetical protein
MSVDSISITGQWTPGCSGSAVQPVPGVAVPTCAIRCRDHVIEVAARRDA